MDFQHELDIIYFQDRKPQKVPLGCFIVWKEKITNNNWNPNWNTHQFVSTSHLLSGRKAKTSGKVETVERECHQTE